MWVSHNLAGFWTPPWSPVVLLAPTSPVVPLLVRLLVAELVGVVATIGLDNNMGEGDGGG